jgi:hypothetical protein
MLIKSQTRWSYGAEKQQKRIVPAYLRAKGELAERRVPKRKGQLK